MKQRTVKNQLPYNLVANILSFLVNVTIGLWLVPYLVDNIGKVAYGLIPLAMVFTEYISIITISINGSITRFLTIDIHELNWDNANKTFNTALFALLVLILAQTAILSYVVMELDRFVKVPTELLYDSYFLFGFTFLGYLISLNSSILSTSMYSLNRIDLIKTMDISRRLLRIISIVVLFSVFEPSIKYVGIANLIGASGAFLVSFIYWRLLTPELKIKLKYFDRNRLGEMMKMGWWVIVNQVGFLLFLKMDLIIINRYLGPSAGGEYAAIQQWSILIRTVASVLSGVIGPAILISYSKSKIDDVIKYGFLGVKYLSLFVGTISGIIAGIAPNLLNLWLGPEYTVFSNLLFIMIFHFSINLGVLALFHINIAFNKVKTPGLVTLSMGIVNLILAIIFVEFFNLGIFGVALAGSIALTLKNGLFTPWYASRILNIKSRIFYRPIIVGSLIFSLTFLVSRFFIHEFIIETWIKLIIVSSITFLIVSFIIWSLILDKTDKQILLGYLPFRLHKVPK